MNELDFATVDEASRPYPEYLRELGRHRFSLAPAGNGLDTHRAWESLYLGVLPLVEDSPVSRAFAGMRIVGSENGEGSEGGAGEGGEAMKGRSEGEVQLMDGGLLPMVVVDDWRLISLHVLDAAWGLALERRWHWEVLALGSWRAAMQCCSRCPACLENDAMPS